MNSSINHRGAEDTEKFLSADSASLRLPTEPALNAISQRVIGAAIEVHRHLGPGFLESVYEEALCVELGFQGILFERQKPVSVTYKGAEVGQGRLDLLVEDCLVVELKTVERFEPIHQAQVISYLKATGLQLGLLINFKSAILRDGIKRVILSEAGR